MKKHLIMAAMATASVLALGGCSGSSSTATTAAETVAETTAAEAETQSESSEDAAEAEAAEADAEAETLAGGDGSLDAIKAKGKLVVGTNPDFAPWVFKNVGSGSSEVVGADVELAQYIADKLGVEMEMKSMEFSALLQACASDTIDLAVGGFAYTEERAEAAGLSHFYNYDSKKGQGLLVKKGEGSKYNTAESFAGTKIAVQNATLQYNLVDQQLPDDVTIQPVTSFTDGVLMVTNGKVDAIAVSGDNGAMLMKSYPEVEMADFMFEYNDEGNVLVVKKGNNDLLNAVNEAIDEVNEQGLYAQWRDEAIELAESIGVEVH